MTTLRYSTLTATLSAALWLTACGGAQTKADTAATKAAGPAATAKTPCGNCSKADCSGCGEGGEHAGFKMMTAEQLRDRMQAAPPVTVIDVNSDERWAKGHVPGARHMLRENLNASTLPTNKDAMLVFYCGSSRCKASHKAASAAVGLGYTNVWVMGDGIKGWEEKGLKTEQ